MDIPLLKQWIVNNILFLHHYSFWPEFGRILLRLSFDLY